MLSSRNGQSGRRTLALRLCFTFRFFKVRHEADGIEKKSKTSFLFRVPCFVWRDPSTWTRSAGDLSVWEQTLKEAVAHLCYCAEIGNICTQLHSQHHSPLVILSVLSSTLILSSCGNWWHKPVDPSSKIVTWSNISVDPPVVLPLQNHLIRYILFWQERTGV